MPTSKTPEGRRNGLFGFTTPEHEESSTPAPSNGRRTHVLRRAARDRLLPLFDLARPSATDSAEAANAEAVAPAPQVDRSPKAAAPQEPLAPEPPFEIASGEKAKARDILGAIRTLKAIEQEGRPATPAERQTLARFSGFGPLALSIFPDPVSRQIKDASWQAHGEELQALTTPAEYESAKRSTFNAFYTSPTVIAAMHALLARLGVPPDAVVLEPGCGTGNFMSLAPPEMRFVGIELDLLSGRIARALHPRQDIRIENFRDTQLADGSVDAVIGNVPFADLKLDHRGQRFALHDYFFAKAVDALRPGGALALVTSRFTLDKQNAAIREHLASKADFIGAIRLPSDTFKREGTAVVTDIVLLRKRRPEDPPRHLYADWLGVAPLPVEGEDITINRYFLQYPEMVLGRFTRQDRLYGDGFSVIGTGDLAEQLNVAVLRLPWFAASKGVSPKQETISFPSAPAEPRREEGGFFIDDDRVIRQQAEGRAVPVEHGGRPLWAGRTPMGKRLAALIRLRDAARQVLRSQNEGWPEAKRQEARRELNWQYDRFVFSHGPINKTTFSATRQGSSVRRMPNLAKFREDPDAMLVMALEEYDEATGKSAKAAIMTRDVVGRKPPITSVPDAQQGLLVALDQKGQVDLPLIAQLYGKLEEDVIAELGDLVFHDPVHQTWQTADAYLSGNVRAKLAVALGAGPAYARNSERLGEVQPEDVLPGDIDANLGAPWIPASDVQGFAAELFRVEPSAIEIEHLPKDAVWSVVADYAARQSVGASSEFGTSRAGGAWLLELALNMKTPVIYDPDPEDPDRRIVNQEETLKAREKQKLIKERFRAWLFADIERTERLVRRYNDTYNNLRPRRFDGGHLAFPGMNETVRLRSHQRDAIWRCMSGGNTLLAQAVGAGKTYILAAAGMKMRQAGLIRKPMYVVPNHLLEQFGREFLHLYPNARLLIAAKEDLARDRRKRLTAKIASGDWDGILVTHSSFERIGMSRKYQERFLQEQIDEYEALLTEGASRDETRAHRNLIKLLEKQKAAREERLKELLAEEKKDDGLVFDELGVDQLFVDEAQQYKNLETPTKMERVAGIQTGGSERAFDMFLKARWLHERHPGHGVVFATGTPISNTMVEMHTMQRYLDPQGLVDRGIAHFDAWAATFGEVVDAMEISPDGKSLRLRSRFARFTNLPELQQMFRAFADVQTAEMLDLPRPKLESGKAIVVACPMSEAQCQLQKELVERYERLRSQKVDPREDNALNITTDGRKLALDARMVTAQAPDHPESKVNALVEKVAAIWRRTAKERSAQLVFCDLGVHPTPWGYSAYGEVIEKLVAQGVPREQIAAAGDADTDQKKQALFERVRSGAVRVLLGSTQKMGTGTNVQKRLVALHHLDAPWKPAEVEQREGRILRQGNENAEVAIYRYVTEGSFDAYMWQALETKSRFIAQVMTGENVLRRAEDVAGRELSYAEVKAIASGNPAVLTLAEADAEISRLLVLNRNHLDEQYLARKNVRGLPAAIAKLRERLTKLLTDQAMAAAHGGESVIVGERSFGREEAISVLANRLASLPISVRETQRFPLGICRGLTFGLVVHPRFAPDVYVEGAAFRQAGFLSDHQGPRALLNAVERLVEGTLSECERVQQELAIAEAQLRDHQARLGRAFVQEGYLVRLTELRDQLKDGLSGAGAKPDAAPERSVAKVVEQIKLLQVAHRTEAPPVRVGSGRVRAEEAVTTRIRRRLNDLVVPERATEPR